MNNRLEKLLWNVLLLFKPWVVNSIFQGREVGFNHSRNHIDRWALDNEVQSNYYYEFVTQDLKSACAR